MTSPLAASSSSSEMSTISDQDALSAPTNAIALELLATDPEVCQELANHAEGQPRNEFALMALRIGVMAIRQAQGRVDADVMKHEGDRLVGELRHMLDAHQSNVNEYVASCLKSYFDPESGRFSERVHRLVKNGGEIEEILKGQVGEKDSELVKTLAKHIGEHSPLMKLLHPEASDGLISSISSSTETALIQQRERILREFSLDNKEGALARLIAELDSKQAKSGEALEQRIDAMVSEFSLDKKDSALSRLVGRVEQAQKTISSEFSLDTEGSALARLRTELVGIAEKEQKSREEFYRSVATSLAEMNARKEAEEKGTRHGLDFEDALYQCLEGLSRNTDDVVTATGHSTGLIKNSKVGDIVIDIGPEQVAAGSRIVIEAKQKQGVKLKDALSELETARKNRDAEVGLFVYSKKMAGDSVDVLSRYGNDLVLVWDQEDPISDVALKAALSLAKALCTKQHGSDEEIDLDVDAIDTAMRDVEKQLEGLDEISRSANTISSSADKILKRAELMQKRLDKHVDALNAFISDVRRLIDAEEQDK